MIPTMPVPAMNASPSYWMPFTANRAFRQSPRMLVSASGFQYRDDRGRELLDGFSGLWCSGAGHARPRIVEAIREQSGKLDYAIAFQVGHPLAFELAERLCALAPDGIEHVFFSNSGSEAVDTALKIALAWHRARGDAGRARLIGRLRGYHGVGFGGISVGGIAPNRQAFSAGLLPQTDHLPDTHDRERQAFSRGQPEWGAERADALLELIRLHGADSIAAVIVEPVAGSTGILPPPKGYLERLRAICSEHGILLIFDEVITAFGRVGDAFASQRFGVTPDIITTAKGLTNGAVPMGATLVSREIHDELMQGPPQAIELFHGYTYSAHPLACAAALACLDLYDEEDLFRQARESESDFEQRLHDLRDLPHVVDIRNFGLMGAIELESRSDAPGARGLDAHIAAFEQGLVIRNGMDTIQIAPFLAADDEYYDRLFGVLRRVLAELP